VTAVALAQRPPLTLDPETGPEDIAAAATEFAEQLSEPALPPPIYALFGITAGGPIDLGDDSGLAVDEQPVSAARISAHFGTAEAAAEAAPIIRERLETGSFQSTGEPYTDRFASWQVDVVERQPLVVISIESKDRPIDLRGMLYQRDVGFLAW
jgi:hypothetical protein